MQLTSRQQTIDALGKERSELQQVGVLFLREALRCTGYDLLAQRLAAAGAEIQRLTQQLGESQQQTKVTIRPSFRGPVERSGMLFVCRLRRPRSKSSCNSSCSSAAPRYRLLPILHHGVAVVILPGIPDLATCGWLRRMRSATSSWRPTAASSSSSKRTC